MSNEIDLLFNDLCSKDDSIRLNAFKSLQEITGNKVPWFDKHYDELVSKLNDTNSYQRSIGIMLICDLSKSDKNKRIKNDIAKILVHINDEKFITSRQCIQNIWKVAVSIIETKEIIEKALIKHFKLSGEINHGNLIRQDIISALWEIRKVYDDIKLDNRIMELIELEKDEKNRKKLQLLAK